MDFEGNNIDETRQLHYLKRLHNLQDLNLVGNPIREDASTVKDYYKIVQQSCTCLQTLDDEDID